MPATRIPDEQLIYARWLAWGTELGLVVLAAAFVIYAFGLIEPLVPLEELPALWHLPAEELARFTGAPTGWQWLSRLHQAEYLNLLGVSVLALVTLACYCRLVVALVPRGARLHAALAIAQVLVLLAAASGFFGAGH